jgi:hypothetical protein
MQARRAVTIEGKPVLMVYDLRKLVGGLGSIEETADALAWRREQAVRAGLEGLHFQLASWGAKRQSLSGLDADAATTPNDTVARRCLSTTGRR